MTSQGAVEHALTAVDEWHSIESRLPAAREGAAESDARAAAGTLRGPLDGRPFAVKANIDVAGIETTAGTTVARAPAEQDGDAVHLLRAAGAIPTLTTTLAEAAIGSVTANPWTGTCVSPRDRARHAGGSSGGSAAVVAAGLVPFALGSDTMGSVRIPAACCGVYGWKPTRDLISTAGLVPLSTPLDTVGVLAASLVELRHVADALAPTSIVAPLRHVAVVALGVAVDEAAQRAVDTTVRHLQDKGIEVTTVHLDLDPGLVRRRGLLLCEAEAAAYWGSAVDGEPPGLSPAVRKLLAFGRDADDDRIAAAEDTRQSVEAAVSDLLRKVDALILPTLPGPPPLVGDDPVGLADLTAFVNLAGVPALSLPTSIVADGETVPRSIQLIGATGTDISLIAFAADHLS